MFKQLVLFLLFTCCCLCDGKGVKTTQSLPTYPCGNQIVFGIETSNKMDKFTFQRQINFFVNYTFEKWTDFKNLELFQYANSKFKYFGSFKTKTDLTNYIQSINQIKPKYTLCNVLEFLAVNSARIILFLNEFQLSDVNDDCIFQLKLLFLIKKNAFAFVTLSDQFNTTILEHYFKQAKIIEWDVQNDEVPNDWEKQFDYFYGCGDQTTTTSAGYLSSTKEPTIQYPPCNSTIVIAFDKSTGFTKQEYQGMQSFLIEYVFKDWTRFNNLNLYSFTDHIYSTIAPISDKNELIDFIQHEEQIDSKLDLCNFFQNMFANSKYSGQNIVIFLSTLDGTYFDKEIPRNGQTCQENIEYNLDITLTFVLLNDNINIDTIRQHIPQAQFIKLDLKNWEWNFLTSYGCNEDDVDNEKMHPCDSKFIFAYQVSSNIDKNVLDAQKNFLLDDVFDSKWNVFDNLALVAYSNNTQIQDFGTLKDLNTIHSFIDMSFKQQSGSSTSLCNVFKQLTTMYLKEVNIILFVNEFHNQFGDECTFWMEEVRDNINSINFINLTKNANIEYFLARFPQAKFTPWHIKTEEKPNNWNVVTSYGCKDFFVNATTNYPCYVVNKNSNHIIYEKSRYLSLFAYQRLTDFLLTNVFIKQWVYSYVVYLYNYPDEYNVVSTDRMEVDLFIRESLKSQKEPLICKTLNFVGDHVNSKNLLFFISKFDEDVLLIDMKCEESIKTINENPMTTFIVLTQLVNETLLQSTFPNAKIVNWNIEEEEVPLKWNQMLWEAFGCKGLSPIILPTTPAPTTVKTTTKALTTTTKGSTVLNSTTQQEQLTSTTSPLITTATILKTTTKAPDSKRTSKEVVILLSIFIPLLIVVVIGFVVCFCLYRCKQRKQLVENIASNKYYKTNVVQHEKREEDPWEISFDCLLINFLDKIGSGEFGDVYLGRINGPAPIKRIYTDSAQCKRFHNCNVAVKTLPALMQVDDWAIKEFQKEIEFMKSLKCHNNIVCFLGYVNDFNSPLMLLEYCGNGDLLKFIKTNKQKFIESSGSDCKTLISFAWQISSGLEYLSSLGLIHRDVAARNILLDSQNVCKVSDFGLCRLAEDLTYQSKGGKLPIRWMAIESLKDYVYSQKTDVWSYGVLLWELFSLGDLPYVHIENILAFIESGKRLDKPHYCSDEVYEIMMSCWLIDPEERPTFTVICQLLSKMLETSTMHYNYVDTLALIEEANQIEELDEINV